MTRRERAAAVARKVEALLAKTTENGATPGEELASLTLAASLLDRYFLNNGWWQTASGPIHVSAMEVRHVKNCMRLIERTGRRQEWLVRFHLELVLRQITPKPIVSRPPPTAQDSRAVPRAAPRRRKNVGIDIYMNWPNQTEAERDAQITGFSTAGDVGYLREAYHGGPYVTRFFVQEAFEDDADRLAAQDEDVEYKGPRIPAATLLERLPAAVIMAIYRAATIYGEKETPWIINDPADADAGNINAKNAPGTKLNTDEEKAEVEAFMKNPEVQKRLNDVFAGIEIMKGGGDEKVFAAGIPPELLTFARSRVEAGAVPDYCMAFVNFARLAERKEKELGHPVNIYASY